MIPVRRNFIPHGVFPPRHCILYQSVETEFYPPFHHREDGPSMVDIREGGEDWFQHNVYHRLDGPAVIEPDGHEIWYCGGNLHRDWGPAEIRGGRPKYYFYGNQRERYPGEPEI